MSKESILQAEIPESSCARKETADIDILVTSRNGDRKIMQYIKITSRPPYLSPYLYQSNTYRKDLSWLHFNDESRSQERQQEKEQQSCLSDFVAYLTIPSSNQKHKSRHATVFHAWPYGRFLEIHSNLRRKKLHRTNQGSNFLGGTLSNRNNVNPTQNTKSTPAS